MINLLPYSVREEREYGRKNRLLVAYSTVIITTAFIVAIIMIGSLQFVGQDTQAIEQTIEANETQIVQLESNIEGLKDVANRLQAADTLFEQNVIFSQLIPEIASSLPQGTVINGLSLSGGVNDTLSLNVSMVSADLAPVLQRTLTESALFDAADIGSISPTGNEESVYAFSATVNVSFADISREERQRQVVNEGTE